MRPIGIFGIPDEKWIKKVFELRKKVGDKSETIPHLTLVVNLKFDKDIELLKSEVFELSKYIDQFGLLILGIKQVGQSVALEFDNGVSKKLAEATFLKLKEFKFEKIETDYMKTVGIEGKEELEKIQPQKLLIDKIVIAGGEIREKDIIGSFDLNGRLR